MQRLFQSVFFIGILVFVGCSPSPRGEGGVAISFDDRFIEEWYSLRPLFEEFNARVTLYVNGDTLSYEQISMLRQLANEGHEIAFHGTIHGNAAQLLADHGPDGYAEKEIDPGLAFFRRHGFNPTSYAHPGGTSTRATDSVLLSKGFINLREVSKAERFYKGVKLYHLPPSWMPHIFYDFDGRKKLYALQIDRETTLSQKELNKALSRAQRKGEVLMLFGHQPLTANSSPDAYGFDVNLLKGILAESQRLGLRFYTMSELN
jgi:peptidoglycan/xylan/chitin deacetylase (PgdA/CDA1 family)